MSLEWDILSNEIFWVSCGEICLIYLVSEIKSHQISDMSTLRPAPVSRGESVLHLFVHWRVSCEELISECGIQLRVMEHSIINIRSDENVFTPGFTISCISFQTPLISLSWTMNSLISITLHIWIKDCPHFMLKIMHTLKKTFFLVWFGLISHFSHLCISGSRHESKLWRANSGGSQIYRLSNGSLGEVSVGRTKRTCGARKGKPAVDWV